MRSSILVAFVMLGCGAPHVTEPATDSGVVRDVARPETSNASLCDDAAACESRANIEGPVHGVRDDGRVDVTAAEAWPSRPVEPKLPTRENLARACVSLAACLFMDDLLQGGWPSELDSGRATWASTCAAPPGNGEENAIPTGALNERLSWLFTVALESPADCPRILAARTRRPEVLNCESHGCEWRGEPIPNVTCVGTVATLSSEHRTDRRDCAHAFTTCDPKSPTGCADRPLLRCDPKGADRCDGDVHLGCRMIGLVSFRDCARYGGTCRETGPGTAQCVYPGACRIDKAYCEGTAVHLCALGEDQLVECTALGFSGCRGGRCI